MGCAGWVLTFLAPWGNKVSATSPLLQREYTNYVVKNNIDRTDRHLWPSKWQRQLFLLTCVMISYDRFICKEIFTSYVSLCYCIIWPSFLFNCFGKIWATCENFWGNGSPPPLAKNCSYVYACSCFQTPIKHCQTKKPGGGIWFQS